MCQHRFSDLLQELLEAIASHKLVDVHNLHLLAKEVAIEEGKAFEIPNELIVQLGQYGQVDAMRAALGLAKNDLLGQDGLPTSRAYPPR